MPHEYVNVHKLYQPVFNMFSGHQYMFYVYLYMYIYILSALICILVCISSNLMINHK